MPPCLYDGRSTCGTDLSRTSISHPLFPSVRRFTTTYFCCVVHASPDVLLNGIQLLHWLALFEGILLFWHPPLASPGVHGHLASLDFSPRASVITKFVRSWFYMFHTGFQVSVFSPWSTLSHCLEGQSWPQMGSWSLWPPSSNNASPHHCAVLPSVLTLSLPRELPAAPTAPAVMGLPT